ncbi:putative phospholipid-transporting ATPase 9-like protein, partial [Trifolium medium]|nr:putative phospholipid-transporting ATPase 9-like protein [Trifolium medium]
KMGGGRTRKKRNQLSRIHAFSSGKTSFKAVSNVVPLVVVVAATIGKEAVEDWRRMKQIRGGTSPSARLDRIINLIEDLQ